MTDLPIACTLAPGALEARRQGLLSDLLRRANAHEELADGHRFSFPASNDTLALITTAVAAERLCCRFLRFRITIEPDEGPLWVELTGPAGTREFLSALFEQT
jgi:hypothetical protein